MLKGYYFMRYLVIYNWVILDSKSKGNKGLFVIIFDYPRYI